MGRQPAACGKRRLCQFAQYFRWRALDDNVGDLSQAMQRQHGNCPGKPLHRPFGTRDVAATMRTMVADPYVNHIPVMTGGVGQRELARFYANHFIPKLPADTRLVPISRMVGDQVGMSEEDKKAAEARTERAYRDGLWAPIS